MTTLQALIAELKHLAEAEREEADLIDKLSGGARTPVLIAGIRRGFAWDLDKLICRFTLDHPRTEETCTQSEEAGA